MERLPTGLNGLDENIGGGFPQGFNILLVGHPGTGKSVFLHHLVNKYLEHGFHVIFVTTDRNEEQLLSEVPSFKKHSEDGRLVVIDGYSWKASRSGGELSLTNLRDLVGLSTMIKKIRRGLDTDKVVEVFDIMSEFFLWNDERSILRFVDLACARARMSNTLALFVLEKGMQSENSIESLKALTQATLRTGKESSKRWLAIDKVEATDVKKDFFPFTISEQGEIMIE